MNYIKGKFKQVIFASDTGYRVGLFKVSETDLEEVEVNKSITYTGLFSKLEEDSIYKLYGSYIFHDRYGYQFNVSSYEKVLPEGKDAIIEFLTSSFVKGCGEATAKKIYKEFGDKTIVKIKEDVNNLLLVPGMTKRKAQSIYNSVCKYFEKDDLILKLKDYGFTVKETFSLFNKYGEKIFDIINNNIYELKVEIDFKKLDKIFLKGHDKEDSRRVKACIIETMKTLTFNSGDIYLYKEEIESGIKRLFNIESDITNYLISLMTFRDIMIKDNKYYLMVDYLDELYNAINIQSLMEKNYKVRNISKIISEIEKENNIKYNDEQKFAIKKALESGVSIITGGPGTGKTTIVKGIINAYAKINKLNDRGILQNVLLLAPTGRAAKRVSETTSYSASTIHRFLKWDKENNVFGVNEFNQLHYNLIIIDETSMIDNHLLASLFKGLDIVNTQIIFVGDEYQLPSVGPGLILKDLIMGGVTHIRLEQIYRQSENSFIPLLAKCIKNVEINEDIFIKKDDFSFIECDSKNIKKMIMMILEKMTEKKLDEKNIQILAPMYKGENGIDNLNLVVKDFFNPSSSNKKEVVIGPVTYRVNDKILNLVNDVDKNIYNGDIGFIIDIDPESKKEFITASYDGKIVNYKREDIITFTHAYAISIHKSQGSEFDHIIMPITKSFNRMLYNKLLYTGVSRAKKSLILIGSYDAFLDAMNNNYSYERKTTLASKIKNNLLEITHNNTEV